MMPQRTPQDRAAMKVFGANLRKFRENRGLSLEALGEQVGRSANALGNYERGEQFPPPSVLAKLVVVLHVSWGSLFHRMEDTLYG